MGSLEYTLGNDDYIAFNSHVAFTSPAFRAQSQRVRATGTIAAAATAALVLWLLDRNVAGALIMAAAVALSMWLSWPWIHRRTTISQLKRVASKGDLGRTGPVQLGWDETGLHEDVPGGRSTADWSRLRRVGETKDHLFLFLGDLEALIVPKRAGSGVAELAAFARARASSRPSA